MKKGVHPIRISKNRFTVVQTEEAKAACPRREFDLQLVCGQGHFSTIGGGLLFLDVLRYVC